jgi:hypothetical protein
MPVNKTGVKIDTNAINPEAGKATQGAKVMMDLRNKFGI